MTGGMEQAAPARRLARLGLWGALAGALLWSGGAAAQQQSPAFDPAEARWQRRCGGVDQAMLATAYEGALAHVRARGLDEAMFEKRIRHDCPRRDYIYYQRVMKR